ncbi:Sodium ion-translocating decarboxylase like protein [Aduncisulcus paluster]|uniref:Sodium ion-translocating decarboxylase like protein n=1 Tax=Aduncisulcus paluster TaxID=2918883 RepID=A0ABQ5KHS5_9EUKA|nr:Sodium ion-translocating decarboxylase like protein [Aduncisulcus paluster]
MELINNFKDPVLIEQLTLGEKISASLFVTVLGMTITFAALVVLWGLTALYSKMVQNAEAKKKANSVVEVKPSAPAAAAPKAVEPEEDEEELIAVISAAIAAELGTSMHNIIVRNIVRVSDATPAWGQSGRIEQMNSRM